jgi:putative ABC transport system permease protein
MLGRLTAYLRGFARRRQIDAEAAEELQFHLDHEIAANVARGMSSTKAKQAALRALGGVTQTQEAVREIRTMWLDSVWYDTRHAVRSLRRSPVFTAVALVTIALGIGASTAIFSVVNSVLLRPLAYARPAELMYLTTGSSSRPFPVSVAEYLEFRQFNRSFADVGAFRTGEVNLMAGERALRVRSATVDSHLLNVLRVDAAQGRLFGPDDSLVSAPAQPGAGAVTQPVALISYELWQSAYGAQSIIGHTVDIDGRRLQVVGVLGRGVDLMDTHTGIWLPLGFTEAERQARNNHNLTLIGRLKEDVTAMSAQNELNALTETWSARTGIIPTTGGDHAGHVFQPAAKGGEMLRMTPLADQIIGSARQSIWVLQAAVGLVLLIACANVANLLLARAETRQREFAVLTALGAGRGRLVRRALTESVILAVAGGTLGVLLARAGVEGLVRVYQTSLPRMSEVTVDLPVMLVSFATAVVCGLVSGLAPMMRIRSDSTAEALKSGPRGSSGTARHHVRRALVMAETALAVIVVVGAGLLLRTVQNLTAVDEGFDRSRLVTFSITLPRASFDLMGRVRAYQRILDQLRAVPGVRLATAMTGLPLERPVISNQTEIANSTAPGASLAPLDYQRVMSGFFETTGIPILQGRGFQSTDVASAGGVAVVNETLAKTYWTGRNPFGQRLRPAGDNPANPWFTVIGVARDVMQTGVDRPVRPEVYALVDQVATDSLTSFLSISPTTMHVVVRTTLPLATLAPTIARVVRDVDPAVPVARLRGMDEVFTESIRGPRLLAQLVGGFGVLALLLAAIGTYGVLSYLVTERRREIGIRMALGANPSRVLAQVMKHGVLLTSVGVAAGVAGALGLNRLMASLLFGVQPTDAGTLAAVILTISLVAVVACGLPAWRASRLDPNVVLRED